MATRSFALADDAGASMVEYGLLLAAIAIVVAVALPLFASRVTALFGTPLPFLP